MLNFEELNAFSLKYEQELNEIDEQIKNLEEKRVVALAKCEVAKDFLSLFPNEEVEQETISLIDETQNLVDENY